MIEYILSYIMYKNAAQSVQGCTKQYHYSPTGFVKKD